MKTTNFKYYEDIIAVIGVLSLIVCVISLILSVWIRDMILLKILITSLIVFVFMAMLTKARKGGKNNDLILDEIEKIKAKLEEINPTLN